MAIHSGSCSGVSRTGAYEEQNVIVAEPEAGKSRIGELEASGLGKRPSWCFPRGPGWLAWGGTSSWGS